MKKLKRDLIKSKRCKFCGKEGARGYWKGKECCDSCFRTNNSDRKIEDYKIKNKKKKKRRKNER